MESNNGSASVTPTPRRNVRRGRCVLVLNLMALLLILCPFYFGVKGGAVYDSQHDGRETIIVARGVFQDRADGGHVGVFDAASEGVGHEPFGEHAGEDFGIGGEGAAEFERTTHFRSVEERS